MLHNKNRNITFVSVLMTWASPNMLLASSLTSSIITWLSMSHWLWAILNLNRLTNYCENHAPKWQHYTCRYLKVTTCCVLGREGAYLAGTSLCCGAFQWFVSLLRIIRSSSPGFYVSRYCHRMTTLNRATSTGTTLKNMLKLSWENSLM